MNVSVGGRWASFIDQLVHEGRYASVSEVVREGLRLVEERETKLKALREHVQAGIAEGGSYTDAEVAANIDAALDKLEQDEVRTG